MTAKSDDGFWEMKDGNWVPTEKQKQAIALNTKDANQSKEIGKLSTEGHTKFVAKTTTISASGISTNTTGNDGYIGLNSLTTTTTHTSAAKAYMGNPFYQGFSSRREFNRIQDPGADKLKKKLLFNHNKVESLARSKFVSGDMSHNAEQIIQKMYYPNEKLQHNRPLKIRRVEVEAPSDTSPNGFKSLTENNHFGVRGILTTDRILLIDSTEDAVTDLTNPKKVYQKQFLQRNSFGIYEISHRIMHDFWYKSIPLDDVKGTEFHFSHYSNSSQVIRRFHHFFSVILLLLSLGTFAILPFIEDEITDNELGVLLGLGLFLFFLAFGVYYFASQFKLAIPISDFGKERNLKIGYFDRLHQRHLVLKLTLEDSQTIVDTVDWIKVLDKEHQVELKPN